MSTQPITPNEVTSLKRERFPEEAIQAINELIALEWNGSYARFTVDEAADAITDALGHARYRSEYLDFEDIYREAGWKVTFTRSGYNESWSSYYEFRRS